MVEKRLVKSRDTETSFDRVYEREDGTKEYIYGNKGEDKHVHQVADPSGISIHNDEHSPNASNDLLRRKNKE